MLANAKIAPAVSLATFPSNLPPLTSKLVRLSANIAPPFFAEFSLKFDEVTVSDP